MTERTTRRRIAAMLGAAAVGITAMAGVGTAAMAAPQDFGNIDTDRTGSLTVHKYLHQTGDTAGDISAAPAAGDFTDPVAGVEFTAFPLLKDGAAVDLGISSNWDTLADLTPGAACTAPAGYTLGTPVVLPETNAAGTATAALPVGAYQVCETAAPADIIDRAQPFILTIPMPYESGWVYDVHAYPKNGKGVIEKTIDPQQDTGLGSVVRFPVTVPVPAMAQTWTGFGIVDELDDRLEPLAADQIIVTVDGAPIDSSYYIADVDGQTMRVSFTPDGLNWLNEGPNAQVGKKVQVIFAGTVVKLGSGTIPNVAEFWPNNPGYNTDGQPPIPSNEVKTNWGDLEVQKRAAGTSGTEGRLNGAVFEVYNAVDPYAADCSTAEATGSPVVVNGETEFTSAGTGVISIAGLFVSDNVHPVINAQQRCYVLKETAAPAGYVLPVQPFTPVAVKIGDTTVSDNVEIVNTQQEVPELPLTGAAGQVLLIAGGAAAVAVALGLVMLNRRKQHAEQV